MDAVILIRGRGHDFRNEDGKGNYRLGDGGLIARVTDAVDKCSRRSTRCAGRWYWFGVISCIGQPHGW